MKITGFGTITSNSGVNKRGRTGSAGGFSDLLSAAEASESGQASQSSEIAAPSLSNLLALQEISEEDVQRRKLVQHGNNMLDELEKLRRQLLMGTIPAHMLGDLARQLSQQRQFVTDPRLTAIIDDIELRTAVELAKLEVAAASKADPGL